MAYKFLYLLLVLILIFEFAKSFNRKACEAFASSPTDNRLSNSESDSADDKFANDGEEILVLTQTSAKREPIFNYIRAPLNKGIMVYIRRVKDGRETQISNFPPMLITSNVYKTLNMLGQNNMLIDEPASTLNYYIKFLTIAEYNAELNAVHQRSTMQSKYNNCLQENSTMPKKQAAAKCKTIFS